jgi:hypothetical protein
LLILGWAMLSVAIVIIAEEQFLAALAGWVKRHQGVESNSPDLPLPMNAPVATHATQASARHSHFGARRLAELLAIIILASLTYLPLCDEAAADHGAAAPTDGHQSQPQCPQCPYAPTRDNSDQGGSGEARGTTLHLSQALETALLSRLTNAEQFRERDSGWPPSFFQAFLILVAIVTVALLLKGRGKEAAPVGALGLAALVLEHPEHFSHLEPSRFSQVFYLFVGVTVVLVGMCGFKIIRRDSSGANSSPKDAHSDDHQSRDAPLTLTFATFVLLWSLIGLAFHAEPQGDAHQVGGGVTDTTKVGQAAPPRKTGSIWEIKPLEPVLSFGRGKHTLPGGLASARAFEQALKGASIKPSDVLLLIGSADCTPIRHTRKSTNKDLAEMRASWLREQLDPLSLKANARVVPIEQHEDCGASPGLRAVFPVLIRATAPDEFASQRATQ